MTRKLNPVDEIINEVIKALEDNTLGKWIKSWNVEGGGGMPHNCTTTADYHGINVLMLWLRAGKNDYPTHQWCTFKQAIDWGKKHEAPICVRKGEKGTRIIKMIQFAGKDCEKVGEQWYRQGQAIKGDPSVTSLKAYTVFNISQLDGLPEHLMPVKPELIEPDYVRMQHVKNWMDKVPVKLEQHPSVAAFYPSLDKVSMPPFKNFNTEEDYWSTLAHELGHWTGGKARLDRTQASQGNKNAYAFEELIAELTSVFVCSHLGVELDGLMHKEYLGSYTKMLKEKRNNLISAASKAQKAFDLLNSYSLEN